MKAVLAQLDPAVGDKSKNLKKLEKAVAGAQADLFLAGGRAQCFLTNVSPGTWGGLPPPPERRSRQQQALGPPRRNRSSTRFCPRERSKTRCRSCTRTSSGPS